MTRESSRQNVDVDVKRNNNNLHNEQATAAITGASLWPLVIGRRYALQLCRSFREPAEIESSSSSFLTHAHYSSYAVTYDMRLES